MTYTWFIRPCHQLSKEHYQPPRTCDTVRSSLDGSLCVLAFALGTEPDGWEDGMSEEEIRTLLSAPESEGVWWVADE